MQLTSKSISKATNRYLMAALIIFYLLFLPPTILHATVYNVGPGQTHETLSSIDWQNLQAGDEVRIHWREAPYKSKIGLRSRGTQQLPVRITGVAGPNGQRPVISGDGATTPPSLSDFFEHEYTESLGVIVIHRGPSDDWGYKPGYIQIEGLKIEGGHPDYSYQGMDGKTYTYFDGAAGIWAVLVEHLVVRDCEITNNGNGLFILSKNNAEEETSRDALIEKNHIHGNGIVNSDQQHNIYTQVAGITFQYNRIGRMRANSGGSALKDRSSNTVIRYNYIESGARTLDLVEPEDSHMILMADPSFHDTWVYGNIIINEYSDDYPFATNMFHYGGDSGEESIYRKGVLHFFNNTVYLCMNQSDVWSVRLFDLSTNDETVTLHNNVFYLNGSSDFYLARDSGNHIIEGNNWINDKWQHTYPEDEWHHFNGTVTINIPPLTGTSPGFNDPSGHDFTLQSTSALHNKGITLPASITTSHPLTYQYKLHQDYEKRQIEGNAPDIGALEMSGSGITEPLIKIRADNSQPTMPLNSQILLYLTFAPGQYSSMGGDWWIVQVSPKETSYFDLSKGKFIPGFVPTYQGAFFAFSEVAIPAMIDKTGEYFFYFIIDTIANGVPDLESGQMIFDFTSLTVQ